MQERRCLLIIGAGPNQLPAIRLARERGFRIVVTDMDPAVVGFALADEYGVVSTRDIENTVAFAKEVHRKTPLSGVMTMASESAVTVARVAAALGLPGLDPEAAFGASNKAARQRCFHEHRVPSPRFAEVHGVKEAIARAEDLGWPVVVKPVDSAGSRAVRKVSRPDEMEAAFIEARSISSRPEVVLEEFLRGSEHSIEGIVVDGEIFWTGFSDRNYDKKEAFPPYFLEDGDTLPSALSAEMQARVEEVAGQAVRALGIEWGPAKGDILIDDEGPKVLEMAARLSGDYFCYETVPLHNGTDLLGAVMDLSVGLEVKKSSLEPKYSRGVALRYVWPEPGRVVAIQGLDDVRKMPGVHFFRWEPKWAELTPGVEITRARSMGERVGSVMTFAETRDEAVEIAERAIQSIHIVTAEVEGLERIYR